MQIELIMQHITPEGYEFEDAGDWDGNVWSVPCCVLDLGCGSAPAPTEPSCDETSSDETSRREGHVVKLPNKHPGFLVRCESDGGGVFWEPTSGSVYAVDDDAYHAMLELDRGLNPTQVARQLGVTADSVFELIRALSAIAVAA